MSQRDGSKEKKSRRSTETQPGPSTSQPQQQLPMAMPYYMPYYMPPPPSYQQAAPPAGPPSSVSVAGPSAATVPAPRPASPDPWLESDSDFEESSTRVKPQSGRKRGRPSKAALEERERRAKKAKDSAIVNHYPSVIPEPNRVAFRQEDECHSCRLYKGRVLIKPCGHAKYCFDCVNKLRSSAIRNQRPSRCLHADCLDIVTGWFILFNINV